MKFKDLLMLAASIASIFGLAYFATFQAPLNESFYLFFLLLLVSSFFFIHQSKLLTIMKILIFWIFMIVIVGRPFFSSFIGSQPINIRIWIAPFLDPTVISACIILILYTIFSITFFSYYIGGIRNGFRYFLKTIGIFLIAAIVIALVILRYQF